ncbi:MAG TPA: cytochrome c [Mycobacteriales bacterium]|nr:cytochrome c [Mycobacteriales bacterium]
MSQRLTSAIRRSRTVLRTPSTTQFLRGRWARRISGTCALIAALGIVGIAYSELAPKSEADPAANSSLNVRKGQELFDQTCITCHGANLQGVNDRGPSLIGVGQASVYFQLKTGRMPLAGQGPQADPKKAKFDDDQIDQIAAFVQANGGGPTLPEGNLRHGPIAEGGELFRLNCASCHSLAGAGGALSGGKFAPKLNKATDKEIYAAMLSGPGQMPDFGDKQISPEQKRAIINYLQSLKAEADPGGNGIGRLGPVPEGLVAWVVAIPIMLIFIFWIGAKVGARGPKGEPATAHAQNIAEADPTRENDRGDSE